jgi:hypothetical protein
MLGSASSWSRVIAVPVLALSLVVTPVLSSEHVVPRSELQKAMVRASEARSSNLAAVRGFFSSERASKALGKAGLDASRVNQAVSLLDDAELAELAARTRTVQNDFAAGALSNQQVTYILIALATALIVTIIFVAD